MAFRLLLPKYARSPLPSFPLAPDTQGLGYCDLFRGRVGRDGKPSAHGSVRRAIRPIIAQRTDPLAPGSGAAQVRITVVT